MKAIPAAILLLALVVTVAIPVSAEACLWGPYITGTNATATTLSWRTPVPGNGSVSLAGESRFAETGTYDRTLADNSGGTVHHLSITGLEPGTWYRYLLTADGYPPEAGHFSTFPAGGQFSFVVYGDTQDNPPFYTQDERHRIVAERIAADDPLFVIHVGDLTADGNDPAAWDRFFSAGRPVLANTTIIPARGNHDGDGALFHEIFGEAGWYSLDCAGARFVILDANDDVLPRMDEQAAWLGQELDRPAFLTFIALHEALYSSEVKHPGGRRDLREILMPVLRGRVDAVFSGDIHAYERDEADGIAFITAGTGGGAPYALSGKKIPERRNSLEYSLGYLIVAADPARHMATVSMVRTADISPGTGKVARIYPPGTVYETFRTGPGARNGFAFPAGPGMLLRVVSMLI